MYITLNGDLPGVRASCEKVAPRFTNAAISPTGARAVFEARGELRTVHAEKGDARNLSNAPASAAVTVTAPIGLPSCSIGTASELRYSVAAATA